MSTVLRRAIPLSLSFSLQHLSELTIHVHCKTVIDLPSIQMPQLVKLNVNNVGDACKHNNRDCIVVHLMKSATNLKSASLTNTIIHSKESLDQLSRPLDSLYLVECRIPMNLIDCGVDFDSLKDRRVSYVKCKEFAKTSDVLWKMIDLAVHVDVSSYMILEEFDFSQSVK